MMQKKSRKKSREEYLKEAHKESREESHKESREESHKESREEAYVAKDEKSSKAFVGGVEWRRSGVVEYERACAEMQARAEALGSRVGDSELLWLLEHPAIISLGRSGRCCDVLGGNKLPVVLASRGGQATYHGPGQRVIYFALHLREHADSVRGFVEKVEGWMREALARCGLRVVADREAIGLWVGRRKIVAMGFRVSRGIITHGVAINRSVDLSAYEGIVSCGLDGGEYGVSSMEAEGCGVSEEELDVRLRETCPFLRG